MEPVLPKIAVVLPAYNEEQNIAPMAARLTEVMQSVRVAIYLSMLFALLGGLLFVDSLVSFLWVSHTVAGWTSSMSAIAILRSGQFFVPAITGEYPGRVMREVSLHASPTSEPFDVGNAMIGVEQAKGNRYTGRVA